MRIPALLIAALLAAPAAAHDSQPHARTLPAPAGQALPLPLGGPFRLTDQHGRERTEVDPDGRLQLLFFGYAACESICSVALPQMAGLAARLRAKGIPIRPVMITVDPDRDTGPAMDRVLAPLDPDFVGLTGSPEALEAAYRHFAVENEVVFINPAGQPVYAHGSLLYLLDGQGRFLTLIPPILSDDRAEAIIAAFAPPG
ncbi:MAG: SCO family protein [Gemmobacter sp.]